MKKKLIIAILSILTFNSSFAAGQRNSANLDSSSSYNNNVRCITQACNQANTGSTLTLGACDPNNPAQDYAPVTNHFECSWNGSSWTLGTNIDAACGNGNCSPAYLEWADQTTVNKCDNTVRTQTQDFTRCQGNGGEVCTMTFSNGSTVNVPGDRASVDAGINYITAYAASSVVWPSTCTSQRRYCVDNGSGGGTLTGSFTSANCTVSSGSNNEIFYVGQAIQKCPTNATTFSQCSFAFTFGAIINAVKVLPNNTVMYLVNNATVFHCSTTATSVLQCANRVTLPQVTVGLTYLSNGDILYAGMNGQTWQCPNNSTSFAQCSSKINFSSTLSAITTLNNGNILYTNQSGTAWQCPENATSITQCSSLSLASTITAATQLTNGNIIYVKNLATVLNCPSNATSVSQCTNSFSFPSVISGITSVHSDNSVVYVSNDGSSWKCPNNATSVAQCTPLTFGTSNLAVGF